MKKISVYLLMEIFFCLFSFSQIPFIEWSQRYPDTGTIYNAGAEALAIDDSGNVFQTGIIQGNFTTGYCTGITPKKWTKT